MNAKPVWTISDALTETGGKRQTDRVYGFLRKAIADGTYAIGDRLPSESKLCEDFGVSRIVIREVLSRLRAEDIVVSRHGSGTYVSKKPIRQFIQMKPISDVEDLLQWQELRIAIEVQSSYLAALHRTKEDIEKLNEIMSSTEEDYSWENMQNLDFVFHRYISECSRSPILVKSIDSLQDYIRSWFDAVKMTASIAEGWALRQKVRVQEHQSIVDAIRDQDPERAQRMMRLHVENGRTRLLAGLSKVK